MFDRGSVPAGSFSYSFITNRGVMGDMRPNVSDEAVEKIDRVVDEWTEVPVGHLTFEQKVLYLAEVVDGAEKSGATAAAEKSVLQL